MNEHQSLMLKKINKYLLEIHQNSIILDNARKLKVRNIDYEDQIQDYIDYLQAQFDKIIPPTPNNL